MAERYIKCFNHPSGIESWNERNFCHDLQPLPIASLSGQNGLNDMSMDVCQAVATSLKLERQQLMVNSQ